MTEPDHQGAHLGILCDVHTGKNEPYTENILSSAPETKEICKNSFSKFSQNLSHLHHSDHQKAHVHLICDIQNDTVMPYRYNFSSSGPETKN